MWIAGSWSEIASPCADQGFGEDKTKHLRCLQGAGDPHPAQTKPVKRWPCLSRSLSLDAHFYPCWIQPEGRGGGGGGGRPRRVLFDGARRAPGAKHQRGQPLSNDAAKIHLLMPQKHPAAFGAVFLCRCSLLLQSRAGPPNEGLHTCHRGLIFFSVSYCLTDLIKATFGCQRP